MKSSILLRISLLIIALTLLGSCAPSHQPVRRSSVPDHCSFQPHKKTPNAKAKKPESPPARTTPIGGNYSIRH